MAYLQTGSSFSPTQAQSKINQARQVEMSTGRAMLETLTQTTDIMQSHAAQEFNKEMELQQEISIQKAITDANIAVKPEQYVADIREGDNAYNIAWNKQQRANVATNVGTLIQSETTKLAEQHKYDPEAFKGAMTGLYESLQEEYNFQGETQGLIQQALMSETERYIGSISANGYARLKQETFAKEMELFDSSMNVAMNSYRTTGDVNRWNEDLEVMEVQIQNMLDNGDIDPSQALKMKQSIRTEGESQLLQGNIDRSLESGDLAAATRYMDAWEDNARKAGIMTPDEIDAELNRSTAAIKARKKAVDEANTASALLNTNGIIGDYKNKKDVKAVDSFVKSQLGANPNWNDPNVRAYAIDVATRTGIVPTQVESYVRTQLYNPNAEQATDAIRLLRDTLDANPSFTNQFSQNDIEYAVTANQLMDSGYDPATAFANTKVLMSEDGKAQYQFNTRKKTKKQLETKSYNEATNLMDDMVDSGWFASDDIPESTKIAFLRDYDTIKNANLHRTNTESATELTKIAMKAKWGQTNINGKPELMAYPPERLIGNDMSGENTVWISNQANDFKEELKSGGYVNDLKNVRIVPSRAARSGVPIYSVDVLKNGVYEPLIDPASGKLITFEPNYSKYQQASEEKKKQRDAEKLEQSKAKREEYLKSLENPVIGYPYQTQATYQGTSFIYNK